MNTFKSGWKRDTEDKRDFNLKSFQHSKKFLPNFYSIHKLMPKIYDQGDLGSCTANAIGALMQFRKRRQGQPDFETSRLFTYYNTRSIEGTVNEDAGASIRNTIKAVAKFGVIDEILWPYDINKFAEKPNPDLYDVGDNNQAVRYYRINQDLIQLKTALVDQYPIACGIMLFSSFMENMTDITGIIPIPKENEKEEGGHAIVIVGYDDSLRRFICRNSWGANWGQKGYFSIPYEYIINPNWAGDFWTIRQVE